jgi:hypothetical protein
MTDLLVIIHILSAAAWIGGSFLTGFVAPRMASSDAQGAALAWARVAAEAGAKYFNPAGILTALSGIGLVLTSDVYGWSDTFVSIGLGVVIATALIGALVHRPGAENHRGPSHRGSRGHGAEDRRQHLKPPPPRLRRYPPTGADIQSATPIEM